MRTHFAVTVALLAPFSFSQLLRADPIENAVKEIRATYNTIEEADLSGKTLKWEPHNDSFQGRITQYFSEGNLVKVHLSFEDGAHGGSDVYYYYSNGELFFAFVVGGYWKFSGRAKADGEAETVDICSEDRLYFKEGRLIRHLYKRAQSTDPALIKSIMAATENAHHDDPEFADQVQRRAILAVSASSPGDIEKIIYSE